MKNENDIKLAIPIGYEASTILHRAACQRLKKYKDQELQCQQSVKCGKMRKIVEPITNGVIIRYAKIIRKRK